LLHGPGMIVELATAQDPVQQAMVTVTDDDIAWPVLSRLCKAVGWKMVDVETGRMFG
jgi:predicted dinucleotide-binding enzyme